MTQYDDWGVDEVSGDVWGDDVVGASPRVVRAARGAMLRLPPKPAWRNQLAPGVPSPGQGLEILPLTPDRANGIFAVATQFIQWQARTQAPFQPERLVVTILRDAALAPVGDLFLAQGIFIGRMLGTLQFASFNIEPFSQNAFGMRLKLPAVQPGVDVNIPVVPLAAITAGTATITMMFLGHSLRG